MGESEPEDNIAGHGKSVLDWADGYPQIHANIRPCVSSLPFRNLSIEALVENEAYRELFARLIAILDELVEEEPCYSNTRLPHAK